MLGGLMENNYDRMWSFDKYFEHSSYIYNLTFLNVMNLDTCQIIELPFEKSEKFFFVLFKQKPKKCDFYYLIYEIKDWSI